MNRADYSACKADGHPVQPRPPQLLAICEPCGAIKRSNLAGAGGLEPPTSLPARAVGALPLSYAPANWWMTRDSNTNSPRGNWFYRPAQLEPYLPAIQNLWYPGEGSNLHSEELVPKTSASASFATRAHEGQAVFCQSTFANLVSPSISNQATCVRQLGQ